MLLDLQAGPWAFYHNAIVKVQLSMLVTGFGPRFAN